jgi:hypothetical protein
VFTYWVDPLPEVTAFLLPGIERSGLVPVWVLPDGMRFDAGDVKAIVESLPDHRCALWAVRGGGNVPAEADARYRAFASRPQLIDGFIANVQVDYALEVAKSLTIPSKIRYVDLAWFSYGQWDLLQKFCNELQSSPGSKIAFLPQDPAKAQEWAHVALGYLWILLNRRHRAIHQRDPDAALLQERDILVSIIRISATLGVIPTMTCTDSDTRAALVLWATEEESGSIGEHLRLVGTTGDEAAFRRWNSRGIEFAV